MIRLAFTGDALCYPSQNQNIYNKYGKYNYDIVFEKVKPLLSQSDYVCCSLETPISPAHKLSQNAMVFNTPVEFLSSLKKSGVNMVTTANNHCLDRGINGLKNTIRSIDKMGLDYTGTRISKNAKNYVVKDINGVKIAYVAYTYDTNGDENYCYLSKKQLHLVNLTKKQYIPGGNLILFQIKNIIKFFLGRLSKIAYPQSSFLDCVGENEIDSIGNCAYIENMKNTFECAKKDSDVLICCLHSGGQFNSEVGSYTNYLIDRMVDFGADVVVCNHTHSVLPIQKIGNSIVAYSLGNFAFTPNEGYYIEGVYADYSILLYLNINNENYQIKPSFSIVKNVIDKDGISLVCPIDLLYKEESDLGKKLLKSDVLNIIKRMGINYLDDSSIIQQEYVL